MRNSKAWIGAWALALFVAAASAAEPSLTGQWQLEITSPQGTRTPSMTLTQTGTQVSGTYKSQRGEVPISGTIQGADFALTVKIETPSDKLTVEYKGRIDGEKLSGRVMMGARGEAAFTGKRAGT
jgi:hypothetical protein